MVAPSIPGESLADAARNASAHRSRGVFWGAGVAVLMIAGSIFWLAYRPHGGLFVEDVHVVDAPLAEAPELTLQVASGSLPSVTQRLPLYPVVVTPVERTGVYGGTWHMAIRSTNDHALFYRTIGYENLVRWDTESEKVIPNIAQSYEVSADARQFTFRLREGMRWSDGAPFTVDDILFWYKDIFSNSELSPEPPLWLAPGGSRVRVERVDDMTVRFIFSNPNGLFLQTLATVVGAEPTSYPKHVLQTYLPAYNPKISALIASEQVPSYLALFAKKFGTVGDIDRTDRWQHPELPTLNPWALTSVYSEQAQTVTAQRNPYYWKIDPAGQQLPYIDAVEYRVTRSDDDIRALAYAGYIDMQDRNISQPDRSIIDPAELDSRVYGTYRTSYTSMNAMVLSLNLTHRDPILRTIFQNRMFRIALSQAINRTAIIRDVYGGHGTPYQAAPRPESIFYDEAFATQYTTYDVARANALLDEAGYATRDRAGYRLRPDGKRISITVDWGSKQALAMIQADWKAVGIEMNIGILDDRTKFYARKAANGHDAATWSGSGGVEVLLDPRYYFPFNGESNYAIPWAYWMMDHTNTLAQVPPEPARRQQELYQQILATADVAQQERLMRSILAIAKEQFYAMGISMPSEGFGLLKHTFHNVPPFISNAFLNVSPAYSNPMQYFIQ